MAEDLTQWNRLKAQTANGELLWHYTDWGGLDGILEKSELWASNNAYLNDAHEQRDALLFFKEQFSSPELAHVCARIDQYLENNGRGSYVISFTSGFDALGQWRAYGGSAGFSIGFNKARLEEIAKSWGFRLARCLYTVEEKKNRFGNTAMLALTQIRKLMAIDNDQSNSHQDRYMAAKGIDRSQQSLFEGALLDMAPEFKDGAFSEEREYRLISNSDAVFEEDSLGFHLKRSLVVPHVKMRLEAKKSTQAVGPPIEAILIGPSPHPHLLRASIWQRVSLSKIFPVVVSTNVPSRNW